MQEVQQLGDHLHDYVDYVELQLILPATACLLLTSKRCKFAPAAAATAHLRAPPRIQVWIMKYAGLL